MECHVCLQPYETLVKTPKNLPCGHTFCLECVSRLQNATTSKITCPKDRKEWPVPNRQVEELPTNYAILEMLGDGDKCAECQDKPPSGQCFAGHCSKRLCESCMRNHFEKYRSDLGTALVQWKQDLDRLQGTCDNKTIFTKVVSDTQSFVKEVHKVFDTGKQQLLDLINQHEQANISQYKERKTNLKGRLLLSRKFLDGALPKLQTASADMNWESLSEIKRKLSSEEAEVNSVQVPSSPTRLVDLSTVQSHFDAMMANLKPAIMREMQSRTPAPDSQLRRQPVPAIPCPQAAQAEASPMPRVVPDYNAAHFKHSQKGPGGGGDYTYPWGIAISPVTGNVAITDPKKHKVHILRWNLKPVEAFGSKGYGENQFNCPVGVVFNEAGRLFITDCDNHRIKQVKENGIFVSAFGSDGSGPGQFRCPRGIAWADDLLYVCDCENYRIQVLTEGGSPIHTIGTKVPLGGPFNGRPWHLAVSHRHHKLVVSDSTGSIHFFTPDGRYKRSIKSSEPPYLYVHGTVIDYLGQVIISEYSKGNLVVLGHNEEMVSVISLPGGEKLDCPMEVKVNQKGDLVVCDYYNHRVVQFAVPQIRTV